MRILYATCSASDRLDDDAADFALGLARMAQHAGHRAELLVQVPAGEGLRTSSFGGVPVGLVAAEASSAVARRLGTRPVDVVHLLDLRAAIDLGALAGVTAAPVVNVDALAPSMAGATPQIAELVRGASCRIAPEAGVAERLRPGWPSLVFDVVAPGVDLLAIAAGRRAPPPSGPLRVGWAGGPWPALERLFDTLGLQREPVEGPPAERHAALQRIDLLCVPASAACRRGFEARAAGVPVLTMSDETAADRLGAWAADAALRAQWRRAVRPPPRIEETAFLYESLYRRVLSSC